MYMHTQMRASTHTFLDVKLSVCMFVHAMLNKAGSGERDPVRRWNAQGGPSPPPNPLPSAHTIWPGVHVITENTSAEREAHSECRSVVAWMPSQRLAAAERTSCMLSHAESEQTDLSMFEANAVDDTFSASTIKYPRQYCRTSI